jgi:MoaA/NifB/PqqE/SkfB family radical SAM enzyme
MYKYKDITQVHIEPTEKCNAACPICPRNIRGGKENPYLINAELSTEDCKKMFTTAFIKQLETTYMCGNFGDPIMAKDTLEIFEYFREQNTNIWLGMNTNAGARPIKWWAKLAKTLGRRGRVIFSIDGLEDTNHIYRQNVKWNILERNIKAYIGAGGRARWDFIVFKHNEHQVEEAQELARKLGFEDFQYKKTGRFWGNYQVLDKAGKLAYVLEPPTNKKYQNTIAKRTNQYIEEHGISFYDTTEIDAKCISRKEIYVSARGFVFPCCWMGGTLYNRWKKSDDPSYSKTPVVRDFAEIVETQSMEYMNKVGGPDAVNALKPWNTIESILDKTNFFNDIENSWTLPSIEQGKLSVCTRMCAKGLDKFAAQWDNLDKESRNLL